MFVIILFHLIIWLLCFKTLVLAIHYYGIMDEIEHYNELVKCIYALRLWIVFIEYL